MAEIRQEMLDRPELARVNAVKNKRVYLLSYEIWTGARTPVGMLYIAKWCYPERFKDGADDHREILDAIIQKDIEKAERLMRRHLEDYGKIILALLDSENPF